MEYILHCHTAKNSFSYSYEITWFAYMSNLKIQKMTNKLPRKHNNFELKKKLIMQNGSGVLMFASQKIE